MSGDLYFNNVNSNTQDYIYVTDCSGLQLGVSNYEIEWTMYMDFTQSGNYTRIFGLGDWPNPYLSMSIERTDNDRSIYLWHSAGIATYDNLYTLNASTYDNTWTTFKLKRVSGIMELYINGSLVNNIITCTHNLTAPAGQSLYIGCQYTSEGLVHKVTDGFYGWLRSFSWTKNGVQQLLLTNTGCSGIISENVYYVHNNGAPTQTFPTLILSNVPCFNKGTQILCVVDDKEIYVPIENIRATTLVKTYKHGAKAVKCIGHGHFINDVASPKKCMFKMDKTESMTDDLFLTGGHAVLVDEPQKGLQFTIEDKFFSFVENNKSFVPLENTDTYTYYNFCIEGDSDLRYGVWANGVLCETPSEKQFRTFEYSHVDE